MLTPTCTTLHNPTVTMTAVPRWAQGTFEPKPDPRSAS